MLILLGQYTVTSPSSLIWKLSLSTG